jgi:polyphosphate glucokinase
MWMVDYGATWIKFYKVEKNKSLRFVSPPTPKMFFYLLQRVFLAEGVKKNETIIVGFPGVIKKGRVLTCPNLDEKAWRNIQLTQRLSKLKLQPYVINDTDLHGHLIVKGKGVELVLSLGTGMGSSVYIDGLLVPNTEIGHHPFLKNKTYEQLLGHKAYLRSGRATWLKHLKLALSTLHSTINPDKIYLTGGLCYLLEKQRFAKHIKVIGNPEPSKKILKGLRLPD